MSNARCQFRLVVDQHSRLASPGEKEVCMKLPKNLGMTRLAVWLTLFGILTAPFLNVSFAQSGSLLALLAIAAGVLLLLQR
jgi:hypothetical protein